MKKFGLWLIEKIKQCGYNSPRQFALKANISPSTISRIASGTQKAEPDTLAKMAPCLGITYEELMKKAGYITDDTLNSPERSSKNKSNSTLDDIIDSLNNESKKELEKYAQLLKIKEEIDKGKDETSSASQKNA